MSTLSTIMIYTQAVVALVVFLTYCYLTVFLINKMVQNKKDTNYPIVYWLLALSILILFGSLYVIYTLKDQLWVSNIT